MEEKQRWALADLVRVEHDEAMTRESLACEVPFGEALRQAGAHATVWLEEMGGQWLVDLVGDIPPPSESLSTARKVTPSRVIVRLHDGRVFERGLDIPVGAAGSLTRHRHNELVRDKFMATGGEMEIAQRFAELETISSEGLAVRLPAALTVR